MERVARLYNRAGQGYQDEVPQKSEAQVVGRPHQGRQGGLGDYDSHLLATLR